LKSRDRAVLLPRHKGGLNFLVVVAVFICTVVVSATFIPEINLWIDRHDFRGLITDTGERIPGKSLAIFGDMKSRFGEHVSISYPSHEDIGHIALHRPKSFSGLYSVWAEKKVFGTVLWPNCEPDRQAIAA